MKIKELHIQGVFEINLEPLQDDRGFFMRTFDKTKLMEANLNYDWVQENISFNKKKNIVRGLHFILPPFTDGKLIMCSKGEIWDVIVDLRKGSNSFGKYCVNILNDKTYKWIYIPKGFAHGFCTLTDESELIYKHDTYYNSNHDSGILWCDEDLDIPWPVKRPIVSEKDKKLMSYKTFLELHKNL